MTEENERDRDPTGLLAGEASEPMPEDLVRAAVYSPFGQTFNRWATEGYGYQVEFIINEIVSVIWPILNADMTRSVEVDSILKQSGVSRAIEEIVLEVRDRWYQEDPDIEVVAGIERFNRQIPKDKTLGITIKWEMPSSQGRDQYSALATALRHVVRAVYTRMVEGYERGEIPHQPRVPYEPDRVKTAMGRKGNTGAHATDEGGDWL